MVDPKNAILQGQDQGQKNNDWLDDVLTRKLKPMSIFQRPAKQHKHEDGGALFTGNLIDLAAVTSSLKQRTRTDEKRSPRLNIKSINVAVRCFGHEIRNLTYQSTGKDLANLQFPYPDLIKKIGEITRRSKTTLSKTVSSFNFPPYSEELSKVSNMFTEGGDFDFSVFKDRLRDRWSIFEPQGRSNPFYSVSDEISDTTASASTSDACATATAQILNSIDPKYNAVISESSYPWQIARITDHDLNRYLDPLEYLLDNEKFVKDKCREADAKYEWKEFMKANNLQVLRKPTETDGLYLYKILGSFDDVSAASFYKTQMDIKYRMSWDSYAIKMDVIDKDPQGESEILHWVTMCPYPMKNREYVFLRRAMVFEDGEQAVILSKATSHPDAPESDEIVRVDTYASHMVIKPHKQFDENGMEFVLTYYDDPQTNIPWYCLDMITSAGISDFMKRVHGGAKNLSDNQDD